MPTKEFLLKDLTVKELRQLAKENRVKLVKEGFWEDTRASRKGDIVNLLLESPRISKKKILAKLEPPPKPKPSRVRAKRSIKKTQKKRN